MDRLRFYLRHLDWKFFLAAIFLAVIAYVAMNYRVR